ncbi:MAG: hypothetical protein J6D15_01435 [Clostridia bacterium]|nr:hypothetical protein [Clostridia bacterium]
MKNLFKTVSKMKRTPFLLMFWGVKFAFYVLLIAFFAYKYNQWTAGSYENGMLIIKLVQVAFSLFVQFILGGIILDCYMARK